MYLEDASSTMVEIEGITAISSIKGPLKFFLVGNCTEVNHVCPRLQCVDCCGIDPKNKKMHTV